MTEPKLIHLHVLDGQPTSQIVTSVGVFCYKQFELWVHTTKGSRLTYGVLAVAKMHILA